MRDYRYASSVQLISWCLDALDIRHSVSHNAKTGGFVFYGDDGEQIKFNPFEREADLRSMIGEFYDDRMSVRALIIEWLTGIDVQ
ncbi:MAG: hypothetical protein ACRCXB_30140 [Aeromonadaceae bacterium]